MKHILPITNYFFAITLVVCCASFNNDSNKNKYNDEIALHESPSGLNLVDSTTINEDKAINEEITKTDNKNYPNTTKELFGIEITDKGGWKLKNITSDNPQCGISIIYEATNVRDILESTANEYFNKCLAITSDGNYSVDIDRSGFVTRRKRYSDFSEFRKEKGNGYTWLYNYNNKSVVFSMKEHNREIEFNLRYV